MYKPVQHIPFDGLTRQVRSYKPHSTHGKMLTKLQFSFGVILLVNPEKWRSAAQLLSLITQYSLMGREDTQWYLLSETIT